MSDQSFQDDLGIPNDTVLIRRIPPFVWNFDNNQAQSRAFHKRRDERSISLYIADETDLHEVLKAVPGAGVVSLVARDVRSLGFGIARVPADGPPGHVEMYGVFSKGRCRQLRNLAKLVKTPERPEDRGEG